MRAAGKSVTDRRWRRHERDYASNRQVQDVRLALAGTFYGGGVRGSVDPPAHAIALSLDERSQIQALERTQPGLPLKKGRAVI